MMARRLRWWVGGAYVVALLVAGVVIVLASISSVVVKNDGDAPIRLSGCSIDDSLDLGPGQSGSVDVPGPEGCTVYDQASTRYLGCVTLANPHPSVVLVRQSLHPALTARECEDIG